MKKYYLIILFLFYYVGLQAQQDLYVGGEFIGGTLGRTDLESSLLDKKNYSPSLGGQINVNFRLFDVISLEAGLGQHWNRIRLRDEDLESELDGFSIDIENTNLYWNYYAAASVFYKIGNTDSYIYGKFAISNNVYKAESISKQANVEVSSKNINRSLVYTTSFQESNVSYIPEIGVQHKFFKGNLLSLGLRYNMGQSQVLESTYTVTDNITQETRSDRLQSVGDAFAFTLRFDYKIHHFAKREKVKKVKLDEIAIDVSKKDEQVSEPIDTSSNVVKNDEPKRDTVPPKEIANRDLVVKDRVKVHSEKVKILIWDHQTVDGDRVSLNLNNEWILENYELQKEKYELEVELEEGLNTFVLHALNLGKYKPNTAALIVDDGHKRHRIILESNLNESGTLQITYKKKKNESK